MNHHQPAEGTDIFAVSNDYIVDRAAAEPCIATIWGISDHDLVINDYSADGWAQRLAAERRADARAGALTPTTTGERVAIGVLRERAQLEADMIESGEYDVMLARLNGHHTLIRDAFDFMPTGTGDECERLRRRLLAVPDALARLRDMYLRAARDGRVAARRQALSCADQCELWSRPDGGFVEIGAACRAVDVAPAARVAAEAFGELGHWLRDVYAPIATERDAIGRERYRLLARFHNGADLDLDDTYAWGWHELRSISSRMEALAEVIRPGAGLAGCIGALERDERYAVDGADAFIAWCQATIERTFDELHGRVFEIPTPLRDCRAVKMPPGLSSSAYYTAPNEDFSRPGMVWQPIEDRSRFSLWDALATLYHESVPGHHLQLGHMMYRHESLTRFQRIGVYISGHGEGWALYAERLMHELGYLADPAYELGWLAGQTLRAARVVIDIGLHCEMAIPHDETFHPGERWTFDLAVEFLVERLGLDRALMRAEVERYLGMGGQAIAYKVGERVWVDGRERVERRLGDRFDLKAFHTAALDLGAMGLDQLIDEFDRIGGE